MPERRPRLVVIGAGITGLAAAHRLTELDRAADVRVLEASARSGGVIATEHRADFTLEGGPDSFVTDKPWALALCKRLGLDDELIPTRERFRRTLVVRDGKLEPLPDAFQLLAPARLGTFLRSNVLSWRGRVTALKDLFLPRGGPPSDGDESLASFVRRRLGTEVLERIAQPMIGGIYTADPETLSLASTMPRFLELERQDRSVILGLAKRLRAAPAETASGARFGLFVSLRRGLGALVQALEDRLPSEAIHRNARVTRLTREASATLPWRIELANGDIERADGVILALPGPRAAEVLSALDAQLAAAIARIRYASTAIVSLAYRRADFPSPPAAFGFVVPRVEGRKLIACSFSSIKYEGRAPEDHILLRVFVGGALQPELFELPDAELVAVVRQEIGSLLGVRAEPSLTQINRWPESMPQYQVGHAARVAEIERSAAKHPGLALAGNAFHGVGLADCVREGEGAAERLVIQLAENEAPTRSAIPAHDAVHHH